MSPGARRSCARPAVSAILQFAGVTACDLIPHPQIA
jgi:hypothetical protein